MRRNSAFCVCSLGGLLLLAACAAPTPSRPSSQPSNPQPSRTEKSKVVDEEFLALKEEGNFQDAVRLARERVAQSEKESGPDHLQTAIWLKPARPASQSSRRLRSGRTRLSAIPGHQAESQETQQPQHCRQPAQPGRPVRHQGRLRAGGTAPAAGARASREGPGCEPSGCGALPCQPGAVENVHRRLRRRRSPQPACAGHERASPRAGIIGVSPRVWTTCPKSANTWVIYQRPKPSPGGRWPSARKPPHPIPPCLPEILATSR